MGGGRFPGRRVLPYWRRAGRWAPSPGAGVLSSSPAARPGFELAGSGFAANGYAEHSPGGYSLLAGFVTEVVLTFFFLLLILGSTDRRAPAGFAPIAIGLG